MKDISPRIKLPRAIDDALRFDEGYIPVRAVITEFEIERQMNRVGQVMLTRQL